MSKELTMAAQQALEALKNVTDYDQINAASRALQAALTQRPAAQSEAQALAHNMMLWREDAVHNGNEYVPVHVRTLEKVIAQLRDLPAPQQATPGWSYAQVRVVDENTVDIGRAVAFADEQATPEPLHLFEFWWESHMTQATQSQAWAAWTAAQNSKGATIDAAQPATPPQQAAGEPVGEPTFAQLKQILDGLDRCHARDSKAEFLRVWIRDWAQHKIEQATRPAQGVPDVEDLRDRLVAISAAVADSDDRAAQSMLGEILRTLAAAQAKGGQA